ncbi:MFS general substrate transporter [Massarina eburnea CBS 473.64]|uniref:MFS general substrate transporter n=1 Tax=Massarina eburnea CBS 473.64 TaxID=1395130 RepID=A0A6A6SAS2_9PLEO|nr:MFS general substrate transporter [Massarina eburnea CBS 473.64]
MSTIPTPVSSDSSSLRSDKLPDVEQSPVDEKSTPQTAVEPVSLWHPSQFPDGGRDAWLCLLGAACLLFCSFGWLNCVGVFQNYYSNNQLREHSSSQIAWIASLQIFMMFFPGPLVGFLYDNHGPKPLILVGGFFHIFGLMMTSLCTEYWQFILAQGICSPLGLNCIFNAGINTIPTWFLKKRGAAYGGMAAGSGLGGVIFPVMASRLIPMIGYGWTMRTFGFLIMALLLVALVTVKSRLPPRPRKWQLAVFVEPFKDRRYILTLLPSFVFFFGLFIPINYIEVQALSVGMSMTMAGYLLPVLNAASIFGRILPGALADKFGPFNLQTMMGFVAAILVFGFGLTSTSNAAIIVYAALYGFASGAYVSLLPAQLASISKVEQIGVRTGVTFSITSFAGLVGNPIAGALLGHGQPTKRGFDKLSIFAGCMLMGGAVLFTVARFYVAGGKAVARV